MGGVKTVHVLWGSTVGYKRTLGRLWVHCGFVGMSVGYEGQCRSLSNTVGYVGTLWVLWECKGPRGRKVDCVGTFMGTLCRGDVVSVGLHGDEGNKWGDSGCCGNIETCVGGNVGNVGNTALRNVEKVTVHVGTIWLVM